MKKKNLLALGQSTEKVFTVLVTNQINKVTVLSVLITILFRVICVDNLYKKLPVKDKK